jgi:hypothetical protein
METMNLTPHPPEGRTRWWSKGSENVSKTHRTSDIASGQPDGHCEPPRHQGRQGGERSVCSTRIDGGRVTLESPAFAFTLDTGDGLRAVAWDNRLTGGTLDLGNGPEVEFDRAARPMRRYARCDWVRKRSVRLARMRNVKTGAKTDDTHA